MLSPIFTPIFMFIDANSFIDASCKGFIAPVAAVKAFISAGLFPIIPASAPPSAPAAVVAVEAVGSPMTLGNTTEGGRYRTPDPVRWRFKPGRRVSSSLLVSRDGYGERARDTSRVARDSLSTCTVRLGVCALPGKLNENPLGIQRPARFGKTMLLLGYALPPSKMVASTPGALTWTIEQARHFAVRGLRVAFALHRPRLHFASQHLTFHCGNFSAPYEGDPRRFPMSHFPTHQDAS